MKKLFKGSFMKEVVAETAILSALIILPMAFLGPGWRVRQQKPFVDSHGPGSGTSEGAGDGSFIDHEATPGSFKDN